MNAENNKDQIEKTAKDLGLGPTGNFPEGKLDETDEGGIKIAIGIKGDQVVLIFGKPVSWIGFPKDMAQNLAISINEKANQLK